MFLLSLFLGLIGAEGSEIPTAPEGDYFHFEPFNSADWDKKWTVSKLPNYTGAWALRETGAPQALSGEKMIFMDTEKSYYGLSTQFEAPLVLTDKTLVLQYEIRLQESLECGGAYMKLFGADNYSPDSLCNETRYVIMFGPDKCGSTNKVHFIFRYKNPKTGVVEEKHMKDAPSIKTDKLTHLYTLIVRPDNSYEILIDAESAKQGSLLSDFEPAVNPPREIDDPTDTKPADWVDNELMDDPDAQKPADWDEEAPEFIKDPAKLDPPAGWLLDEPKFISDPDATKPEDWDDDIHGEWEAPTIPNPKCEAAPGCGEYDVPLAKNPEYKGKWTPPQIKNPAYKGVWQPRKIANPDFYEDLHPHNFPPIVGAGFELWMVNKDIGFGNVLISTDEALVHKWNKNHFLPKHKLQEEAQKKLEPEKTEKPKSERKGAGFVAELQQFGQTLSDAWMNLYTENQALTIVITALLILVPIILIIVICCRSSPAPPAPAAPSKNKEEKEEEKSSDDKESEEKDSDDEEKEAEPKIVEISSKSLKEEAPAPKPKGKKKKSPDNF